MRKITMKALLSVFVIFMFAILFAASLRAEAPSREDAQEQVLAQAQAEAATPEVRLIPEYRRKEREIITEEEELPWDIDSYFRYMPSVDAQNQGGDVTLMRTEEDFNYTFKAFGRLPVEFSLNHEYISIDNTTAVRLPSHLSGLSLGIETTFPFFNVDKTYWRFAVNPSFYSDDYSFDSSAFRIPVQTFLIHQPNDKLTLVAGVAVRPGYDSEILPILGFIYKANDRLTFNIVPKRPYVAYKLNDRLTLFGEGGFNFGEYQITKGIYKDQVLKYNDAYAGAGLQYKINNNIQASVSGGGTFGRYLRYRDKDTGKVELENGPYSEFRIEIKI
ncbi:MAG: hypothetical protein FJZ09_01055 [Candidatus Omnitrophica bacterium]|nr:hypothetical protein [Candidatus Omnitrophota bacterium]